MVAKLLTWLEGAGAMRAGQGDRHHKTMAASGAKLHIIAVYSLATGAGARFNLRLGDDLGPAIGTEAFPGGHDRATVPADDLSRR